jgi:hypothetical protein
MPATGFRCSAAYSHWLALRCQRCSGYIGMDGRWLQWKLRLSMLYHGECACAACACAAGLTHYFEFWQASVVDDRLLYRRVVLNCG